MLQWVACAVFLTAATVEADDAAIKVENAWARRAAMLEGKSGTGNGAAYLRLRNVGPKADALIGAKSSAAQEVEIHETYQDMGMMMMRPVERLELAPGKTVELRPGGYHLMLLNLKHDLKPGGTVDVTLEFRNAGSVMVKAPIK